MNEKTLIERLKETAEDHEKHEQGGGASVQLYEAIAEIERLRAAINELLLQIDNVDGTVQIDTANAQAALEEPEPW